MDNNSDGKIKLGVLWKNVSQKGNKPYLAGRVQEDNIDAAMALMKRGGRLLILSATKRPDKKDPDCLLFVVPDRAAGDTTPTKQSPPSRSAQRDDESPFL